MEIVFSENAEKEILAIDKGVQKLFEKHIEKITLILPRRHMKFGVPFNIENVTKQARIVYCIEENTLYILHCFATNKEYERWYKSFK